MDLTIPPGCTAWLELPENVGEYTIDGQTEDTSYEIKSGKYQITYLIK